MLYAFPFLVIAIGIFFRLSMTGRLRVPGRALDLGEIILAVILIYGFVPGIGFLLSEYRLGEIADGRLYDGYLIEQVEYVQLLFLLVAGSFAVMYALIRNQVSGKTDHSAQTVNLVWPVVAMAVALTFTLGLISWIWGADVGDDYISSYTELRSAPLFVQQFAGIGTQIQMAMTIAAVSLAVGAWPKRHLYVALALVANMAFAVLSGGIRTNAFLAFLAYILAASVYVPGFRVNKAALLAIPALALFLLAGLLRGENDEISTLAVFFNSEFTAVFVTPLDLHMRFPEGFSGQTPFNLYTVDLLRFIPSQLLPFEKVSPSDWYASSFYEDYYAAGGGFAFGILAEIVLGQGAPEAVIRGAMLGTMFALFANWLQKPSAGPIKIISYIWLITLGYQCYRDTSFAIVARAFFHLSPVLIFLFILQSARTADPVGRLARTT
jgi:hypothetical protein